MFKLTGKEFEELVFYRVKECEEPAQRLTIDKYGVSSNFVKSNQTTIAIDYGALARGAGVTLQQATAIALAVTPSQRPGDDRIWQPIESNPDFDILKAPDGRQCVTDVKVCSQASFPLDDYRKGERGNRRKQISVLYRKALFGAITFFTIHFNPRELKTKDVPAKTYVFPVYEEHPLWQAFERGEVKRIGEEECAEYAHEVEWNIYPGKRKHSPDIYEAIMWLAALPFFEKSKF